MHSESECRSTVGGGVEMDLFGGSAAVFIIGEQLGCVSLFRCFAFFSLGHDWCCFRFDADLSFHPTSRLHS